jgi:hypothetical protein
MYMLLPKPFLEFHVIKKGLESHSHSFPSINTLIGAMTKNKSAQDVRNINPAFSNVAAPFAVPLASTKHKCRNKRVRLEVVLLAQPKQTNN